MLQDWADVVFLHWRVEPDQVQRLLPDGVMIDAFDGSAWVGLVPFSMENLGIPGLRPLPLVGRFPEVNVRTYVRHGTRRGVWFFSLDVDRVLPAVVARSAYGLPYCTGTTSHRRVGDVVTSSVQRTWPRPTGERPVGAEITVRTGDPLDGADPLVRFLTSRWALFSEGVRGGIRWAPVEHPPWPLHSAEVIQAEESLIAAAGIHRPDDAPHAMWSPGVPVRVGRPLRSRPPRSTIS